MTVYVDDMYKVPMGQYGLMKMSHMIADTDEELHTMADKIGIKRRWFQRNHYDVSLTKRALAIQNGAVQITMRQLSHMLRVKRTCPPE